MGIRFSGAAAQWSGSRHVGSAGQLLVGGVGSVVGGGVVIAVAGRKGEKGESA